MRSRTPYVLCVDVGRSERIGWADSDGQHGNGAELGAALDRLAARLQAGVGVALGFEAPIWTPLRQQLERITASRGGVEAIHRRPWSAGAGTGALGAALGLMPWCFARIVDGAGPAPATVSLDRFRDRGGLLLWEAFVSAAMKAPGSSHSDDARVACDAFTARWPNLASDIPPAPAVNHAVSAALVAGLSIDASELGSPALVIGALTGSAGR